MLLPILIVSCLVHIYSIGYMAHDPQHKGLIGGLLSTFNMNMLVTANNCWSMFFTRKGIGSSSLVKFSIAFYILESMIAYTLISFPSDFTFILTFLSDFDLNCSSFIVYQFAPVVVYANADLQKVDIIQENKSKSGIYRWINLVSGKTYIGSSVNLSRRLAEYYCYNHLADSNRNMAINRALLKYGYHNFQLEVLEYCDPSLLIEREQFYLDFFKPEYNILS